MHRQTFHDSSRATRYTFFALLLCLDIAATAAFAWSLGASATTIAGAGLLVTFFLLNGLLLFGCLHALLGVLRTMQNRGVSIVCRTGAPKQKHAIVMPIYQEDAVGVMARIEAIYHSLEKTGQLPQFDVHILSDTVDDQLWIVEQALAQALIERLSAATNIYYRRRRQNIDRKSGNIADFVRAHGAKYESMLVLDADSLMQGEDIVRMATTMEASPRIGILQSPPQFVRGRTVFARIAQFAISLYSPLCLRGLDAWQGGRGSYWGHNAMIRIAPFAECCDLPVLPGSAPLGGKILSHDFVEAALMARAGWEVRLATDIQGSYEECPPSLVDFLVRDRRWCQGNFQHLWLLGARGLPLTVRVHLLVGIFSYLAGPLWFLFLICATMLAASGASVGAGMLAYVTTVLFLPKFLALARLACRPSLQKGFGSFARAAKNAACETLFSALIAPAVMVGHTLIVLDLMRGRVAKWTSQNRAGDDVSPQDAWKMHRITFAVGVLWTAIAVWIGGAFLLWMTPILVGLIASPWLSLFTGRTASRTFSFTSPADTQKPAVVAAAEDAELAYSERRARLLSCAPDSRIAVVINPQLNAVHRLGLEAHASPDTTDVDLATLLRNGWDSLDAQQQRAVLYSPIALQSALERVWSLPLAQLAPPFRKAMHTLLKESAELGEFHPARKTSA